MPAKALNESDPKRLLPYGNQVQWGDTLGINVGKKGEHNTELFLILKAKIGEEYKEYG